MTDKPIDLDQHRGISAQKATGLRRMLAEVEANEKTLRLRQDELETQMLAAPAGNWHDAAEKARLEARKKGYGFSEQALQDGSIRLTIMEGS